MKIFSFPVGLPSFSKYAFRDKFLRTPILLAGCKASRNTERFDVPFKKFVVSKVSLQVLTIFDEFQGNHKVGQLFDERVGDLLVGFIQLLGEIIVNFFQGFVGSLFDELRHMFDLSLRDQP